MRRSPWLQKNDEDERWRDDGRRTQNPNFTSSNSARGALEKRRRKDEMFIFQGSRKIRPGPEMACFGENVGAASRPFHRHEPDVNGRRCTFCVIQT